MVAREVSNSNLFPGTNWKKYPISITANLFKVSIPTVVFLNFLSYLRWIPTNPDKERALVLIMESS